MDNIEELLEALRNPGDDGVPGDLADRIHGAYTASMESADAKVAELTGTLNSKDAEVSSLKAHNYDLLRATPAADAVNADTDGDGDVDGDDYDDLFD